MLWEGGREGGRGGGGGGGGGRIASTLFRERFAPCSCADAFSTTADVAFVQLAPLDPIVDMKIKDMVRGTAHLNIITFAVPFIVPEVTDEVFPCVVEGGEDAGG